jgi:hypothetical protein
LLLAFKKDENNKLEGELFGLVLIISWVSLLQYLRVIKDFRFLIYLIVECVKSINYFMLIWCILLFGFSQALFWRVEYSLEGEQTYWQRFIGVIYITFGDFHETDLFNSGFDWVFFFVNLFIICIVMMNLIIGILSERLADILEIKDRVDYEALLDLVFTLEVMRSLFI